MQQPQLIRRLSTVALLCAGLKANGLGEMARSVAPDERYLPSVLPWLGALDARLGSELSIKAGHFLHPDSVSADPSLCVLSSGLCLSEWRPSPDRRRILELFCPGDIIQPAALPALPGLKVVSITDSHIVSFKLAALEARLLQDGTLMTSLIEEFAKSKQRRTILVSSLGGLCAEARVATLFVELSLRLKGGQDDQAGFQMPLSRQDIADYLALNADTLSRIITRFKAEGLFHQIGRDKIYIKDWQELLKQCPVSSALLAEYKS